MKIVIIKETFKKIFNIALVVLSFILLFLIFYINVLPFIINLLVLVIMAIINILFVNYNNKHDENKRNNIIRLFIISIFLIVDLFFIKTFLFINNISSSKNEIINYLVLTTKDSKINKLKEIKNKKVGYYNINNNMLNNFKLSVQYISYNDITDLYKSLNSNTSAIIIEDTLKNIIDENSFLNSNIKVIGSIKSEQQLLVSKEIDVTSTPFNVYISGIDTYGAINSVSRSDANLILTVNPITHKILITSIPRDYYVKLHSKTGNKDKLTHASIYGIQESISTIEDLLKIKINYYIKVNFTSVVDLVNELGGIDVLSEYEFTSIDGYKFKKGYNSLNGDRTLSFIRERYAFKDGDRMRGKNQQEFLKSLINALINPKLLLKYNTILNKMNNKISTNMPIKDISLLIKNQLINNIKWNVEVSNLDGENSYAYTYTYPNEKLYVMLPNETSLVNGINKIKEIEGEING